jgi:hypothetical protein
MRFLAHALLLLVLAGGAGAQTAAEPFAPIAHWVGGEWVATVKAPSGAEIRIIRSYEWSFDKRVLIGRSFGESEGKRRQTRMTVYLWNPDSKKIDFTDVIDNGGFGLGSVEERDGRIYLEARIVGNDKHPAWRAWVTRNGDGSESFEIEAEQQGKWGPFGTWVYRRTP